MKFRAAAISVILGIFFFQGCAYTATPEKALATPMIREIRTVSPSVTDLAPVQPSATFTPLLPTVTLTKTVRPTSTMWPTHTATITPLSTLDASGILGLIDTNGGCQLPCWWGIEPGKTTSEQARTLFRQFATKVETSESGTAKIDGKVHFVIGYWIEYDLPGSVSEGDLNYYVWDKTVVRIAVGPSTAQYRYTLDQLLTKMGKPTQVFVRALYDAPQSTIPFSIVLYYPELRLLAAYWFEAEEIGDQIRACPGNIGPELIMWAPEYQMESRLQEELIGPDSANDFQTLEDATNLSLDEFHEIFGEKGQINCIESPMQFWESLE